MAALETKADAPRKWLDLSAQEKGKVGLYYINQRDKLIRAEMNTGQPPSALALHRIRSSLASDPAGPLENPLLSTPKIADLMSEKALMRRWDEIAAETGAQPFPIDPLLDAPAPQQPRAQQPQQHGGGSGPPDPESFYMNILNTKIAEASQYSPTPSFEEAENILKNFQKAVRTASGGPVANAPKDPKTAHLFNADFIFGKWQQQAERAPRPVPATAPQSLMSSYTESDYYGEQQSQQERQRRQEEASLAEARRLQELEYNPEYHPEVQKPQELEFHPEYSSDRQPYDEYAAQSMVVKAEPRDERSFFGSDQFAQTGGGDNYSAYSRDREQAALEASSQSRASRMFGNANAEMQTFQAAKNELIFQQQRQQQQQQPSGAEAERRMETDKALDEFMRQVRNVRLPAGHRGTMIGIFTEYPGEMTQPEFFRIMRGLNREVVADMLSSRATTIAQKIQAVLVLAEHGPRDSITNPQNAFAFRLAALHEHEKSGFQETDTYFRYCREAMERAQDEVRVQEVEQNAQRGALEGRDSKRAERPGAGVKKEAKAADRQEQEQAAAAAAAEAEVAGTAVSAVAVKVEFDAKVASSIGPPHDFRSPVMRRLYANERATVDGITPAMRILAADILDRKEEEDQERERQSSQRVKSERDIDEISFGSIEEIATIQAALYSNFGLRGVAALPTGGDPVARVRLQTRLQSHQDMSGDSLYELANHNAGVAMRKVVGGMECAVLIATEQMRALRNVTMDKDWLEKQLPETRATKQDKARAAEESKATGDKKKKKKAKGSPYRELLRGTVVHAETYKGIEAPGMEFFGGLQYFSEFNDLVSEVNKLATQYRKPTGQREGGVLRMSDIHLDDDDDQTAFFVNDTKDIVVYRAGSVKAQKREASERALPVDDPSALSQDARAKAQYETEIKTTVGQLTQLLKLWNVPSTDAETDESKFKRMANGVILRILYSALFKNVAKDDQLLGVMQELKKRAQQEQSVQVRSDIAGNVEEDAKTKFQRLMQSLRNDFHPSNVEVQPTQSAELRLQPEVMEHMMESVKEADFTLLPPQHRVQLLTSVAYLYLFIEHAARLRFLTAIPCLSVALHTTNVPESRRLEVTQNTQFMRIYSSGYVGLFAATQEEQPKPVSLQLAAQGKQKAKTKAQLQAEADNEAAVLNALATEMQSLAQSRASEDHKNRVLKVWPLPLKRAEFHFVMRQPVMWDGTARRMDFSDVCLLVDLILRMPTWEPVAANFKIFRDANQQDTLEKDADAGDVYSWHTAVKTLEHCYNVERNLRLLCSSNKVNQVDKRGQKLSAKDMEARWHGIMRGRTRGTEDVRNNLVTALFRTIDDGGGPDGGKFETHAARHALFAIAKTLTILKTEAESRSGTSFLLRVNASVGFMVTQANKIKLDDISLPITHARFNFAGRFITEQLQMQQKSMYTDDLASFVLAHHYQLQVLINIHWHLNELPVTKHKIGEMSSGSFSAPTHVDYLGALARIESVIKNLIAKIANHTRAFPTHAHILASSPLIMKNLAYLAELLCTPPPEGGDVKAFKADIAGRTVKNHPQNVLMGADAKQTATMCLRNVLEETLKSTTPYPGSDIDKPLRFAICVGTLLFPEWFQVPDIRTNQHFADLATAAAKLPPLEEVLQADVALKRAREEIDKLDKQNAPVSAEMKKRRTALQDRRMAMQEAVQQFRTHFQAPEAFVGVFGEVAQRNHSGMIICDPLRPASENGEFQLVPLEDKVLGRRIPAQLPPDKKHPLFNYTVVEAKAEDVTFANETRIQPHILHWQPLPTYPEKQLATLTNKQTVGYKTHATARLELLIDELSTASTLAHVVDPMAKRAWQFLRALVYIRANSGPVRENNPFTVYRTAKPVSKWVINEESLKGLDVLVSSTAKPTAAVKQLNSAVVKNVAPPFVGGRASAAAASGLHHTVEVRGVRS